MKVVSPPSDYHQFAPSKCFPSVEIARLVIVARCAVVGRSGSTIVATSFKSCLLVGRGTLLEEEGRSALSESFVDVAGGALLPLPSPPPRLLCAKTPPSLSVLLPRSPLMLPLSPVSRSATTMIRLR